MARIDVTQSPYSADPTGATDATAAIQSALDACAVVSANPGNAAGGSVYLPAGVYKTSSALILHSHVKLFGDGVGTTIWQSSYLTAPATPVNAVETHWSVGGGLTVNQTAARGALTVVTVDNPGSGFRVGDICVLNGGTNGIIRVTGVNSTGGVTSLVIISTGTGYNNSATNVGAAYQPSTDCIIEDLLIFGYTEGYAIWAQGTTSLRCKGVWVSGYGGYVDGGGVRHAGGGAFLVDNTADCFFEQCTSDSTFGCGFRIAGNCDQNVFHDCLAFCSGIDGSGTPIPGDIVPGFDIQNESLFTPGNVNTLDYVMQNCLANYAKGVGFRINNNYGTFDNCIAEHGNTHGFLVGDANSVSDVSLKGCRARSNSESAASTCDGFHIVQATRPRLHDCQASGGGHQYGLNLGAGVSNAEVFGGHFENAAGESASVFDSSVNAFKIGAEFPAVAVATPITPTGNYNNPYLNSAVVQAANNT